MSDAIRIGPPDPLQTAWLDTSDLGNSKRLVLLAQGKLLWIEELQAWGAYDGRRWSVERGAIEAQRLAHRVIEHIDAEVEALVELGDDARRIKDRLGDWATVEIVQKRIETLRGHAVRSGSANMTAGMLKQARSTIVASMDDFDRDPLAYNTLSGTLRFVKGPKGWSVTCAPHDPADRLMQVANVEYDPKATCPIWTKRLAMLTPDAEQLEAFQVLYGYSLTGLTSDQAFYVHQGKGGDGKSATHLVLADLHGDYYRHAGIKTFLQGKDAGGSEHRSDLVRLRGDVRFVTSDEPKARSIWDGEILKQWTGGFVTARGAHERTETTFRPKGKLHVECNIVPRAPSDDKGFRRRFKMFQWKVSLADTPDGERGLDEVLAELAAEKPGILNWLIEGALTWLATRRIPQPAAMEAVLADFWADSSPLLEWMTEWCDTSDPAAQESAKRLHDHYKEWCDARGIEQAMNPTNFGRALRDKQFAVVKDSKGNRWRKGIRLRADGMFTAPGAAAGSSTAKPDRPPEPSGDNDGHDIDWNGDEPL
jgi:putative DNA primase/helicase